MKAEQFKQFMENLDGANVPVFISPLDMAIAFNDNPVVWHSLTEKQVYDLYSELDAIDVVCSKEQETESLPAKIIAYAHWAGIQASSIPNVRDYIKFGKGLYAVETEKGEVAYWALTYLE